MGHRLRRVAAVACITLAPTAGCQPVDAPVPGGLPSPTATPAEEQLGGPSVGTPSTIAEVREDGDVAAAQWQAGARLAELVVRLGGDAAWQEASLTYVGPDADRLLLVRFTDEGVTQQRITLDTLELQPVTADAVNAIPVLPPQTLEPAALVEASASALQTCDVADVQRVLYATGAPVTWDGSAWTEAPVWRATLLAEGRGAVVDPATGEAIDCVS